MGAYPEGKVPDKPCCSSSPLISRQTILRTRCSSVSSRLRDKVPRSFSSSTKRFPFSQSPSSQATTQLKWFAAAKKKNPLFSSHSPAAPPVISLSSFSSSLPLLARCLCLNSAPFVLFPALVLKHRKCSNQAAFLHTGSENKK